MSKRQLGEEEETRFVNNWLWVKEREGGGRERGRERKKEKMTERKDD